MPQLLPDALLHHLNPDQAKRLFTLFSQFLTEADNISGDMDTTIARAADELDAYIARMG